MKKDYYDTLGVSKTSTEAELKTAYRKKAMQFHPDKNPGNKEAEDKFKEAAEAYDVLRDPQKRAGYDKYGHDAPQGGNPFGGGGFGGGGGGFNGFGDINDIFSQFADIFGGMGSSRNSYEESTRGSDLRYDVSISLEDAFLGTSANIKFNALAKCPDCNGQGTLSPKDIQTCPDCNGTGKVQRQQSFFVVESTCHKCKGSGKIIKNPCQKCSGNGRIKKERNITAQIPAGVDNGSKIKLSGEGEAGTKDGRNGDLYIFIRVKEDNNFKRYGSDLALELNILPTTAMIGDTIDVPIIDGGNTGIKIPAGTQHGAKLRVPNRGMPILNSGGRRGDLIIEVSINIPKSLTNEERKLAEELNNLLKNSQKDSGFFKKWFK